MAGFLQASGNPISMSQINSVFDGRGNNLNAYRGTTWFTAAGGSGTFSSGTISFSDFYLKGPSAAITVSLASIAAGTPFAAENYTLGDPATAELVFETNGTWNFYGEDNGNSSGNWATPTTAGVGTGYWIQWTRTAFSGGPGNSASPTSGWQQLNTAQNILVYNSGTVLTVSAQYTINIATDSAGANIVATAPFIQVTATANI
jgi:hypothetical protein